jgi:hypothetical protein
MNPQRLLEIAEFACGEPARRSIFEPLVADWQRELAEARAAGQWRIVQVLGSGAMAYAASFARCMLMRDWLPTPRAAASAMFAFGLAKAVGLLTLLGLSYAWGQAVDLGSIQTQAFLLFSAVIVVPPAFLPALFLMRRDPRSNIRHAIVAIAVAAAGTSALVVVTSEDRINSYFSRFEAAEREYARNLANDRAGRYQYPGTAVRQLGGEQTHEHRRESFARFEAWRAEQIAKRPPRTRTWTQTLRRFQPVALAVLFAVMGWTLAGLAAPTLTRAILWWGLMAAAMLTLSATPGLFMRIAVHRLPYYWLTVPIFAAVTAALSVASWKRPPTPKQA